MSRAKRTNKRRVLVAGLAGAALVTGAVATGAAIAGEDGEQTCAPVDAQSSELAAKALQGGVVDLQQLDGQLSGLLSPLGVDESSLQSLDAALQSIPSNEAGVSVEGLDLSGDEAPQVKLTSMDQTSPEEWAEANPGVDLAPMNAQLASVNESLAGIFSQMKGLGSIQSAFGQIAVNSVVNIDDIELSLKQADEGKMEVKATSLTSCE